MKKGINKFLDFIFPIVTPGVLVLSFIFIKELLESEVSESKTIFFLMIICVYGLLYFHVKRNKKQNNDE
jgi:hypothetical protein